MRQKSPRNVSESINTEPNGDALVVDTNVWYLRRCVRSRALCAMRRNLRPLSVSHEPARSTSGRSNAALLAERPRRHGGRPAARSAAMAAGRKLRRLTAAITALAPWISIVRKYRSPPLLMRPIRCLSPLDAMRGVRPSQAAKCRAERNWRPSPTAATKPEASADRCRVPLPVAGSLRSLDAKQGSRPQSFRPERTNHRYG
jgi:hypothetical protein